MATIIFTTAVATVYYGVATTDYGTTIVFHDALFVATFGQVLMWALHGDIDPVI